MDFTSKLIDRCGRFFQNLSSKSSTNSSGSPSNQSQQLPPGGVVSQSNRENINPYDPTYQHQFVQHDAGGYAVKGFFNQQQPYPTQPNIHLSNAPPPPQYSPQVVYSAPLNSPAPPPPLPIIPPNHHQTHHHHQTAPTTPSPLTYNHHNQSSPQAQSQSSSVSSIITQSSINSPQNFQYHHHHQNPQAGANATNNSQHGHHILSSSSSQPLMGNSSITSPHYPFSIGGSTNSTSTNSPSSVVSPTPPPHSAGPQFAGSTSFSAAQTPESPSLSTGFRRQLSLNMFTRANHKPSTGGGLHLDFGSRNPKSANSQSSIAGVVPNFGSPLSNDLIDTHSLSPRPRPKNLGLSNSHDNINKNSGFHLSGRDNTASNHFQHPLGANSNSSRHHGGGGSGHHHHRAGGLNFPFSNSPSGGGARSQYYAFPPTPNIRLKDEFAKNNRTIKINGKKYENIKEEDFKKISELGAGTFGQVEKMLHKPSGIELAVKKMRRSGNQDDNKHIINDLELLRKCLDFGNIVQCYGYYIMETEVWIFMELMTICFDRLLKRLRDPVPEEIIGKIAVATVSTLNYLKDKHGVIHRDIKPSNILINRQGIIKLCDFGISGRLIDSKAHTRSVGCAAYMAPERIQPPDATGTYDIRSDVWSMGITLVEIATGRFPYLNWKSDFELLSKVIQEDPPTLPEDGGFSPEFVSFVKACLTKDYNLRPKYKDLMEHPFFKHYFSANVDVAQWFKHAYADADIASTSSTSSLASSKNP